MKYRVDDYFLKFKSPFAIAHGTRTGTDIVLLTIESDGFTGTGEASLPPYLPENSDSVKNFIHSFFTSGISLDESLDFLLGKVRLSGDGNYAAKACLDIALHNFYAARAGVTVGEMMGINSHNNPDCTFTLGMGTREETASKISDAKDFRLLKIKLGGDNDKQQINWVREFTNKPLCVDVNQGWKTKEESAEMMSWLKEKNVIFVEQPLPKENFDDMRWLHSKQILPVYADEAVQVPADIEKISSFYDGINIKLMKCGGISEGLKMIKIARKLNLGVLIGSMTETGCGIHAAAQLAPLADYVDLDGPLLTTNNPFDWVKYENGKVICAK